ncbi:hypothetical protein [Desulfovibrio inopinatus]|uniref:hypothetical protein n=1 Tax=Desulfovibrio inopinatus TaxID=102109 RepID=UPI0004806C0B|nr:hypothetical protein [Desulfovibrio inopinatus]
MPRPPTSHFIKKKFDVNESNKTVTFKKSEQVSPPLASQNSNAVFLGLPGSPYVKIAKDTAERLNMEFIHIQSPEALRNAASTTGLSLAVDATIGLHDETVRETLFHCGHVFYIMADVSTLLAGHDETKQSAHERDALREHLAKILLDLEPFCLQTSRFILRPDAPYGEIAMDVDEKMRL